MPLQTALGPADPSRIGDYLLICRLGEGGQGVVYLAAAPSGARVVLKLLRTGAAGGPGARALLVREVNAARAVARFCTAQVLDAQLDGERPYIVSEYVEGPTLEEHVRNVGPLEGSALDRLAIGTVTALAAIHQARIVHRDVKPGNVVLGPDGVRVIDFGVAYDQAGDVEATVPLLGTPAFVAPEQVTSGEVGPAADLFAWASTMVFAVTGHSPFEAGTAVAQLHRVVNGEPDLTGVPEPLCQILSRCFAKHPADRPTAEQVLLWLLRGMNHDATSGVGGDGPAGDELARASAFAGAVSRTPPAQATVMATMAVMPVGVLAAPSTEPIPPSVAHRPRSQRPVTPGPGEGPREDRSGRTERTVRTGRSRWAVPVGAVLLMVLAGAAAGRWNGAQPPGATVPAETTEPAATTSEALAVPDRFAGSWTGAVTQPRGAARVFPIEVTLVEGTPIGRMTLPSLGCSATLRVVEPAPDGRRLTLAERVTSDPGDRCAKRAVITLTAAQGGGMRMFWQDGSDPGNTASGPLTRS